VFADAVAALAELLDEGGGSEPFEQRVRVMAPDRAALLAEFVGDLVFRAEMEGFVPRRLARLDLGEDRLESRVEGCASDPRHLVKAVTYHGLTFERSDSGWRAALVLDV
jgi:SHS2 domain-containing protein